MKPFFKTKKIILFVLYISDFFNTNIFKVFINFVYNYQVYDF